MLTKKRLQLLSDIGNLENTPPAFSATALDLFRFQARYNPLYRAYLSLLRRRPERIHTLEEIPFLPISFFKTHSVKTGRWLAAGEFTSSGTTGQSPSRHSVRDLDFYLQNTVRGFQSIYGVAPSEWIILALLPSYLERQGSSLVAMAQHWIQLSKYPQSGFFLDNYTHLVQVLQERPAGVPVLLLGVSFALLDLAERFPMPLEGVTVMETGGMKGRRKEMTRMELHQALQQAFGVTRIHSEYGMTELLSQAYAPGGHLFSPTPTLRILTTEINDPFCPTPTGRTGVINVIDLANIDTCSFIATEDVGRVYEDGRFEVMGRLDAAEMRGCNLMIES